MNKMIFDQICSLERPFSIHILWLTEPYFQLMWLITVFETPVLEELTQVDGTDTKFCSEMH